MADKRAHTVTDKDLPELLREVTDSADKPEIMRAVFMLSYYAGLRVQEIAGLEWDKNLMSAPNRFMMSEAPDYTRSGNPKKNPDGSLVMKQVPSIFIGSGIGKYSTERTVPMNKQLQSALGDLYGVRNTETPFVVPSGRNGSSQRLKQRANALKMRINRMYSDLGRVGFSSHSGRRSFITRGAQRANAFDSSLKDVQKLAGHKHLVTTEAYIDESVHQARLVEGLYK